MSPAIDRRSGRSRYTSATRSSSRTATRCSPTSTDTSSSRFACGSGARRGGSRRRRCCGRSRSRRGAGRLALRPSALSPPSLSSTPRASVLASAVAVFRGRPRPPRLPRRRLGLVLLDCPASSGGLGAYRFRCFCRSGSLAGRLLLGLSGSKPAQEKSPSCARAAATPARTAARSVRGRLWAMENICSQGTNRPPWSPRSLLPRIHPGPEDAYRPGSVRAVLWFRSAKRKEG